MATPPDKPAYAETPPHQHPALLWGRMVKPAPPRLVVLQGSDEYFARVEVQALLAACRSGSSEEWNLNIYSWADLPAKDMLTAELPALRAESRADGGGGAGGLFSMIEEMASVRSVQVIWGAEAWPSKRAKEFEAWVRAHSDNHGSAVGDVLVLYYRGKSKPPAIPSWVKPTIPVVKCAPLRSWEVPEWVSWRAQSAYGLKLDLRIAKWVASQCGEDLAVLDQDLIKLSYWLTTPERAAAEPATPRGTVAPQDANRCFVPHKEMGPWLLLDAWGKAQTPLAVKILNRILSAPTGDPCMGLTVAFLGHLTKLIQSRALWESRDSSRRGLAPTASELEALYQVGGVGKGRSQRESWLAQVQKRDVATLLQAYQWMAEDVEAPVRRGVNGPSRMRWWLFKTCPVP
jgi:hypothetical protein